MISVSCPKCSQSLKAPDEAIGRKARCPGCGQSFRLEHATSDDEPLFLDASSQVPSTFAPATSNETRNTDAAPGWHIARDGRAVGPVSTVELKQMANNGALRPTDIVWKEGLDD